MIPDWNTWFHDLDLDALPTVKQVIQTGDWSRWFHDDVDALPTVTRVFICRYDFIVDTTFAIDAQLV